MLDVLVISPVRIYREGIANGLVSAGRFSATATTPDRAVATAASMRPDVAVYDIVADGDLEAVRELSANAPGVRVVLLGIDQREGESLAWAEAGAAGLVGRDASMATLIGVVEAAAAGRLLCSPAIAGALRDRLAALAAAERLRATGGLTRREREIAPLVEQGLTNKEIAARLCIEPTTVKNHVHSILGKLGARRRGEAAARLRAHHPGLLERSPPAARRGTSGR